MPPITSEKLTLSYPAFSAAFLDGDRLLVAGGGGESHTGVGNKITLLDVSESRIETSETTTAIKVLSQYDLSRDEDACMSLAVASVPTTKKAKNQREKAAGCTIFAGINSSAKADVNEHFRSFAVEDDVIVPRSQRSLFSKAASSADTYQRTLRARGSVVALASGGGMSSTSGEIVVVGSDGKEKRRIELKDAECADLDLSPEDSATLAYCTTKSIFTVPSGGKEEPKRVEWGAPTGALRSLRYLSQTRLLAACNFPRRTGAELLLIDPTTSTLVGRRKLHTGIKAVSGVDCVSLDGQSIVAVAGADQSVTLFTVESNDKIQLVKKWNTVHPFQITKIAFSEADTAGRVVRLATTSMGNTVIVHTIPLTKTKDKLRLVSSGAMSSAIWIAMTLLVVVLLAVALQMVFAQRSGLPWEAFGGSSKEPEQTVSVESLEGFLNGMEAGDMAAPFEDAGPERDEL